MSDPVASQDIKTAYRLVTLKNISIILILIVLATLLALFSCTVNTGVDFQSSCRILYTHLTGGSFEPWTPDWFYDYYIWDTVVPSVVMALVAGIGLASAGAAMQAITANPLADAYTTGISSGACLGAVASIVVGSTFSLFTGQYGLVSMAFVGGLIPAFIVIALSRYLGNSPATLILLGVAISYFFNGLTTFLMITTNTDSLQAAYLWQIGSVTRAGWDGVNVVGLISLAAVVVFMFLSGKFNLLSLGDSGAKSLGLNVAQFRFIVLLLIAFFVSAIIAYTGILGFVGLVSPHIARFLVGDNNKYVIPASMAIASLMLTAANIVSRYLLDITAIPVGIIMSFIGAPIFLYLIVRRKSRQVIY